jgi:hypothetical protein
VLRQAVVWLVEQLMEAEVSQAAGAGYGERHPDRVARRNGYRQRPWDTRVGSIELAIPRLRSGSYFPSFLEPRRRSEQALVAVVQEAYVNGVSTRKVDRLVEALGLAGVPRIRCRGSAKAWTSGSPPSGSGPWRAPTPTCGWTLRSSGSAPVVEWSTGRWWWLRRGRHRPTRGPRPGRGRGRDGSVLAGVPAVAGPPRAGWACSWWSPTPTRASSRRSPRC